MISGKEKPHSVNSVVITSHKVVLTNAKALHVLCWKVLVVDEAHRIKNPKLSQGLRLFAASCGSLA